MVGNNRSIRCRRASRSYRRYIKHDPLTVVQVASFRQAVLKWGYIPLTDLTPGARSAPASIDPLLVVVNRLW
jgi:hypothetical protein